MIRKKFDYIILLMLFLMLIFISNINAFFIMINPNLNSDFINYNYNKTLEENYNELLKYHNFLETSDINLIISKVKFRDIYDFSNTFTIYKGFKDNIKAGDAVLNDTGLIGVVSKTFEHSSLVMLITNPSSNISVKINDYYGILKQEGGVLIISELNNYENINVGDEIYTSGIGNLNGNIYVGKVSSVELKNNGIEKIVKVDPAVNFDKINYLFVMEN